MNKIIIKREIQTPIIVATTRQYNSAFCPDTFQSKPGGSDSTFQPALPQYVNEGTYMGARERSLITSKH